MRGLRSAAAAVALAVPLALAAPAAAQTFTVTTTADSNDGACTPSLCSLRDAIDAANTAEASNPAPSTIVVPASTSHYTLTLDSPLAVDYGMTIEGAGSASTIIDGGGGTQVFTVAASPYPVVLEGMTITGGVATADPGGGGIENSYGPLTLRGVTVSGNSAAPSSGDVDEGGGGIWSIGSLTIENSTVTDNTATVADSFGDSGGGGIFDWFGDITLAGSTLSGNTATVTPDASATTDANGGGGLYLDGQNLNIANSVIDGNTTTLTGVAPADSGDYNPETAADGGGGIFQFGNDTTIENSTIADNVANLPSDANAKSGGGGVMDNGNSSVYVNTTIANNTTNAPAAIDEYFPDSNGGGGIFFDGLTATLSNVTLAGNSAPDGSGGAINTMLPGTLAALGDSIIANNTDSANPVSGGNCAGPALSYGYNLTNDPTGSNSCSLVGAGDLVGVAPDLGPLQYNGGPAPTEALLPGSPAINAGDPAGCLGISTFVPTDERGVTRPQPANGRCDIGAYELAPPLLGSSSAAVSGANVTLTVSADNPDVQGGNVIFQYGPTTSYGTTVTAGTLVGSALGTSFSASLGTLAPGTYHFRAVATNPDGSVTGADGSFTVSAPAPSVPQLTGLAQAHIRWRAGIAGAQISKAHHASVPTGTSFSFSLDQAASVRLVFSQMLPGKLAGGRCVVITKKAPSVCQRSVRRGAVIVAAQSGANTVTFDGVISASKRLAPGNYTVSVTATNAAGESSNSHSLSFTIVK